MKRACVFHVAGVVLCWLVLVGPARAWDPSNGDWSKSDPDDVRVMTWNILDGICRTNSKVEGLNNWTALARAVAAMKPDVLILQEAGDNSGNGTGSGVDSVSQLETTVDLFFHGGTDPFLGGTVTAYVQAYDAGYDLTHVFVSTRTDGYNRNVLVSRFPFSDLNGDGESQYSDIAYLLADLYAPGGTGGIRGFMFAEMDLPDDPYRGDLVMGNAHLKAGGNSSDLADRLAAAKNVAYFIDYWYNGDDAGVPDPRTKILDSPAATTILTPETPVVIGGDWNEDELTNGRKGPADWLTQAEDADPSGSDGTDRDRSDMTYDAATNPVNGSRDTRSSGKLDYIAWQDSIAAIRRAFIFNTSGMPSGWYPPEIEGFTIPSLLSNYASDHRPVIVDLTLPRLGDMDLEPDTDVDLVDLQGFLECLNGPVAAPNPSSPPPSASDCLAIFDGNQDGFVALDDFARFQELFTGP
jgi:endonuclease/exonuclease/phosphatase family metal-dependent hydrolase